MAALESDSAPITFRCQCTNILPDKMVRHKAVNPTSVRGITRYPAGAHCKNEEVIINFIRRKLCVNPKAGWVIALEKSVQLRSAPNVKSTAKNISVTIAATNNTTVTSIYNTTASTASTTRIEPRVAGKEDPRVRGHSEENV